ncbi:hypothetical protein FKR81_40515 [Lentzea tibetensis]|uniref:Uncharacterized protein n=1 Tax=Lentzea tibetensis TaxID=2591470 RepID=A0A563EFP3_9PSEU|nr:hypothetical protein [Lentzea tibetensis]TWP44888.1 hypothetical protein FKR81_40515 [Lentzea tibetensis]
MTSTRLESPQPVAARLRSAWGLAAGGAVLLAAAPLVGVVGGSAPPAFTSWPLLAALALLPVVVSGVLMTRGRPLVAAAVLAAVAAFAPGRLLSDLQIGLDALAVSRPELLRPRSLDPLDPSAGLWLLIAGHLLTLAAGVLAANRSVGDEADASDKLIRVVLVSAFAAISLLGTPFTSTDVLLLAHGPWDLPLIGLAGGLLVAAAAPLAAALSASSTEPDTRRGGLIGVALAIIAVAAPPLVAGLAADGLGVTWGPIAALVAAALLLLEHPDRTVRAEQDEKAELTLPGTARMHAVAGVFGVLAGAATVVGALVPQLTVTAGLTAPENYAAKLLLPAGVAVAVLGAWLLARGVAAAVRPTFLVSLAALPLTAAAALDTVLAATQIAVVQPGPGIWAMAGGLVLAAVAGVCGAVAGAVEREDTEPEPRGETPVPVLATAFGAGLLAVGAFALPAVKAADLVAPGLFTNFQVASWGLLIGLLAVLAAVALAVNSRPPRAAALLSGAAVVVVVRLLELPLTGARAADASAGPGTWLAAATVVVLLIGAALRAAEGSKGRSA